MRVAFATFGCKINQYDSDVMRRAAADDGNIVVSFDTDADVYVINTCSVTGKSDYQCRQAIRSAARRNGRAEIIVTGCYAQTRPEEIRRIPGVTQVIGNQDKTEIPRLLSRCRTSSASCTSPSVAALRNRTRGFLKIQDGCDGRCTYCIVPRARGSSRSVPPEEVTASFERSVRAGVPEIVLSGIHIGRYGQDLSPQMSLTSLVHDLVARRGDTRLRVSSIEPAEVTPGIVSMLGNGLCRHLHIPLQSGDDGILAAMNRDYTASSYGKLIDSIAARVPGVALGADVMVGFPGEGERQFENTRKLIEDLPLTHLHVFSFSPRPGTPAAIMQHQVPERAKKERSEVLRRLGSKKNHEFRSGFIGKEMDVVVEDRKGKEEWTGLTDNYIRVSIKGMKKRKANCHETVLIDDVNEMITTGVGII
jgi:threonylcarbamoyladenosine tRNA methylthiotransferase MtaB